MVEDSLNTEEITDDLRLLLGDGPIPFPARAEKAFQPWHRPRKQYVRNLQWSREIGYLARDMKLTDGELRYLTLPGSDFLDIRHLHETVCTRHNVSLRYLGFNSAAQTITTAQPEIHSTEFSIKRLGHIHPESQVFPGDFREVGNVKSVSWQRVRDAGHFHAINLDLCGGFAGNEAGQSIPNYFAALKWILQNQGNAQEDFLLFITTRMDSDSIDDDAKEGLDEITKNILRTCSRYSSEFESSWGIQSETAVDSPISSSVGTTVGFMLGLTQWIVSSGIEAGLKASVKSFMTYRTGSKPGDDDIVSLAIRFSPDPVIRADPHGLVRLPKSPPSAGEKECEQSFSIPGKVSSRVKVDEILEAEVDEFQRCLEESAMLLSSTGYSASAYRDWVMGERERYVTG